MAYTVVCPKCNKTNTFHKGLVVYCQHCMERFPDVIRLQGGDQLAKEIPPRPKLISAGMIVSAALAGILILLMISSVISAAPYYIGSRKVSTLEFYHRIGYNLILIVIYLLTVSYGIYRERLWARPMMFIFWVISVIMTIVNLAPHTQYKGVTSLMINFIVMHACAIFVAGKYLYFDKDVKAYYRSLRSRKEQDSIKPHEGRDMRGVNPED